MTTVEYACPYCSSFYRGPIGYHNLEVHVNSTHPEKQTEFERIPRNEMEKLVPTQPKPKQKSAQQQQPQQPIIQIIQQPQQPAIQETAPKIMIQQPQNQVEDQPIPLQEIPMVPIQQVKQAQAGPPSFQQLQQAQPVQATKEEEDAHLPPYLDELPPHEWLESFLRYYNCDKLFIKIQADNVLLTKELPTASTLMNDLKQMKSGHTHLTMIQYICNMYEHRLRAYLKKREEIQFMPRTGVPMGDTFQRRGGVPVYTEERIQPYAPAIRPAYNDDRIARLEDELRKREDQDRRNMETKLMELTMKLEQAQTLQEDPRIRELQEGLKQMSESNRMYQQQLEQQRTENLHREIQDIKTLALSNRGYTPEQIQQMVDQRVREERATIDARHDLDVMIEQKLAARAGTTQADVDMKKAEYELELGRDKIRADSEKTELIGKTISEVAGVFGEGLGRGIASKPPKTEPQQPQGQQNIPPQNIKECPYKCGTQLLIEPGARYGQCPNPDCNGRIEIDPFGNPHIYYEPTQTKTTRTPAPAKEEPETPQEPQQATSTTILEEQPELPEKEQYIEPEQQTVIDYTIKPEQKPAKKKQDQKTE